MENINKNQNSNYIFEGYVPQESTKTKTFAPFPNDPKFHSIFATKYLTSGKLVFMISDMKNNEDGSGFGSGKALDITSENKQEFETFVRNLYNLTFGEQ